VCGCWPIRSSRPRPGGYYSSAKLKKSSKKSRDHDAQNRVYEQTERELRARN